MLLRLHVTPNSDINALTAYWGKASWTRDVKAILESLALVPGGADLDVYWAAPSSSSLASLHLPHP